MLSECTWSVCASQVTRAIDLTDHFHLFPLAKFQFFTFFLILLFFFLCLTPLPLFVRKLLSPSSSFLFSPSQLPFTRREANTSWLVWRGGQTDVRFTFSRSFFLCLEPPAQAEGVKFKVYWHWQWKKKGPSARENCPPKETLCKRRSSLDRSQSKVQWMSFDWETSVSTRKGGEESEFSRRGTDDEFLTERRMRLNAKYEEPCLFRVCMCMCVCLCLCVQTRCNLPLLHIWIFLVLFFFCVHFLSLSLPFSQHSCLCTLKQARGGKTEEKRKGAHSRR